MIQNARRTFAALLAFGLMGLSSTGLHGDDAFPEEYVVDLPVANQFCPPVRTFFFEVTRTVERIGSRTVRHALNGGYGLPVIDKVDGKNLRHLGADVGWHRVSDPVFAVADGVVRLSAGPPPPAPLSKRKSSRGKSSAGKTSTEKRERASAATDARTLPWGNLVVLEHRLPDDTYITTIYGHLGADRRVQAGQLVKAGQLIGSIGKQHPSINGGYKPHLHFGVRKGRLAEVGATLFELRLDGERRPVELVSVNATAVEVRLPEGSPRRVGMQLNGLSLRLDADEDGKRKFPARILWTLNRPGFDLVGYGLSTKDWHDPVAYLKSRQAHIRPARYHTQQSGVPRKRR